jgi:hypothetical protein
MALKDFLLEDKEADNFDEAIASKTSINLL